MNPKVYEPEAEAEKPEPTALPGWPGYRTRQGRSGYDPIDNRIEGAHMTGFFIQRFFTLQVRTHNPVYLFLLGVLGVVLVLPLAAALAETASGSGMTLTAWVWLVVLGICGLVALANLVANLVRNRQ